MRPSAFSFSVSGVVTRKLYVWFSFRGLCCYSIWKARGAELFCLLRACCSPNLFQFWLGFCVSSAGTFSLRFAEYLFSFMVHVMWLDLRGMPHAHFELVSEVDPVRFNLRTPELALISPKCKSSASQGWTA